MVVDNDARESARSVVELWAGRLSIPIAYGVEPQQNIALARKRIRRHGPRPAHLLAFVDDDEEPASDWLREALRSLHLRTVPME